MQHWCVAKHYSTMDTEAQFLKVSKRKNEVLVFNLCIDNWIWEQSTVELSSDTNPEMAKIPILKWVF